MSTGKIYDYCKESTVCVSTPSFGESVLACLIACTVSSDNPQWCKLYDIYLVYIITCLLELNVSFQLGQN